MDVICRFKDEFKNQKNMNKLDFFLNNESKNSNQLKKYF